MADVPDMNIAHGEVDSVLLPDGRIAILGEWGRVPPDGGPIEIFDPEDPTAGFELGPDMKRRRRVPLDRDPDARREHRRGRGPE